MNANTAYIDASSISMVIAAVAGVAVTLGAVMAVYFRRAKGVLMEMLEIKGGTKLMENPEIKGNFNEDFKSREFEELTAEDLFLKIEDGCESDTDPFDE